MVDLLSQYKDAGIGNSMLKSAKMYDNHYISQVKDAKARYSTSVDERETMFFFLERHNIKEFLRRTQYPVTDLRESGHMAQSESEKSCNFNGLKLENNIPCAGKAFKYFRT